MRWAGARALRSVTTTATATVDDDVILADASGGAFTVTLPSAVGIEGKPLTVRRTSPGANLVTVTTTGSQTIGTGTATSFRLLGRNALLTIQSDGTNWQIVNRRDTLGLMKPADVIREAIDPRVLTGSMTLVSGVLHLFAIELFAGDVLTGVGFGSGATALSSGTHQVFGLYDTDGVTLLKETVDNGSTAWGSGTTRRLAWSGGGTYTVPYDGLYYNGIFVVAATPPSLRSVASTIEVLTGPPILHGTADTGLNQATMPNPAAAMSASGSTVRTFVY